MERDRPDRYLPQHGDPGRRHGVALPFDSVLAAFLAGILGGMALMSVVSRVTVAVMERRHGGALYVERGSRRVFVDPKLDP